MAKYSEYELCRMMRAGARVRVNSNDYSEYELRRIGTAASEGSGRLIIEDAGDKSEYEYCRVLRAGAGVTLETDGRRFSEYEMGRISSVGRESGSQVSLRDNGKFSEYELGRITQAGADVEISDARSEYEARRIAEAARER